METTLFNTCSKGLSSIALALSATWIKYMSFFLKLSVAMNQSCKAQHGQISTPFELYNNNFYVCKFCCLRDMARGPGCRAFTFWKTYVFPSDLTVKKERRGSFAAVFQVVQDFLHQPICQKTKHFYFAFVEDIEYIYHVSVLRRAGVCFLAWNCKAVHLATIKDLWAFRNKQDSMFGQLSSRGKMSKGEKKTCSMDSPWLKPAKSVWTGQQTQHPDRRLTKKTNHAYARDEQF